MDHIHRDFTDKEISEAYRNERIEKQLDEIRKLINAEKEKEDKKETLTINNNFGMIGTYLSLYQLYKNEIELAKKYQDEQMEKEKLENLRCDINRYDFRINGMECGKCLFNSTVVDKSKGGKRNDKGVPR